MESVVEIVILLLFGAICATIAVSRGRSGVAWFILGFFFNCISLIIVLVLPDLKLEQERHRRLVKENRRLKEALRKDRHVADARHRDSERRLAAHDRALNLDTGGNLEAAAAAGHLAGSTSRTDSAVPDSEPAFTGDPGVKSWFYLVGDQQVGPISMSSLQSLWGDGVVDSATYVWNDAMTDWKRICDLPDLQEGFHA